MTTRIRELLEIRQLSPTQFADLIGVGRPVISHILSERNKPSLEVVQKVISAFPEVSIPWLLSGTGPMLAASAPASEPGVALVAHPLVAVTAPSAPVSPREQPVATVSASRRVVPAAARALPPRFRPSAKAAAQPTPEPEAASTYVAPVPTPAIARAPSFTPPIVAGAALTPAPPEPQALSFPTSAESTPAEITAPASASTAYPAPTAPPAPSPAPLLTSPAAALSFLGEPGKAIRRIVIFYHDGSFSDYQPEGQ